MHLLFDGLQFQTDSRERGIGRYSANLLDALRHVRPDWQIRVIMHANLPVIPPAIIGDPSLLVFHPPLHLTQHSRAAIERYYADWLTAQRADWVLHPSLFEFAGAVPRYSSPRPRHAVVLYDLIPLIFAEQYLANEVIQVKDYSDRVRQLASADLLLSISDASAADAARLLDPHPPIVSIYGAADPNFLPLGEAGSACLARSVKHKFGLRKPFILYVGGDDFRKNMLGAIDGFAALPEALRAAHDLVLVCNLREHRKQEIAAYAGDRGVGGAVRMTGFVSDDDLRALYQACRLFFFPSRYEGLGLPILEALRCGAPVVAADNSSLPEYAGDVSWFCESDRAESMASALAAALAEPREKREAERVRFAMDFTWEDTARRAAEAIENSVPLAAVPRLPRVAWVSPAPPTPTGIADYAAEVAAALAGRFALEWVVDADGGAPNGLPAGVRVLAPGELSARHDAEPFDAFVYHVGNNHFHTYMLPLMRQHPGSSSCTTSALATFSALPTRPECGQAPGKRNFPAAASRPWPKCSGRIGFSRTPSRISPP